MSTGVEIEGLINKGLLAMHGGRLRLTAKGCRWLT
jgi:hypothetical protein